MLAPLGWGVPKKRLPGSAVAACLALMQGLKPLRYTRCCAACAPGLHEDMIGCLPAQVTNGKNAMPAWADRLSEDEIQDVAAYVFNQATNDLW